MGNEWKNKRSSSFRWVSRKVVPPAEPDTSAIGFLSFEISALMSKLIQIWNRLEHNEFARLKERLSNSTGIKKLISDDQQFLMQLFMKEIVQELQYIAKSIARFGSKCSDPVLHEFEKFVRDPLRSEFDWFGWQYRWKKMDRRVKKMQRFVVFTAELSMEMDILAEVERNLRRTTAIFSFSGGGRKSFKYRKKVSWHRRHVQSLKLMTPWNRTFDYILRLFMRSIVTIIERIKIVFGVKEIRRPEDGGENSTGRSVPERNCRRSESEEQKKQHCNRSGAVTKISSESKKFSQSSHFLSFRDCKDGGFGSPPPIHKTSLKLKNRAENKAEENRASSPKRIDGGHYSISSFFIKENVLNPPRNSLGGAALAIHYGKIVILIEKLASAPHLIGGEERDELFIMLPASIRTALRSRLRSAVKVRSSDPVLAAEWKSAMVETLQWLAPMAHDTEMWHSEQSFEKQPDSGGGAGGSRSHVFLLQTLHYADREKTEAAIVELLATLNNICSSSEVYEKARRSYFCRNDDYAL